MKRVVLFSMLVCFFSTATAQKKKGTDSRLAGLDTALAKLLKDWNAAGFAVAIVEKDKVIYSKGFGYRDFESKKPVTANTLFAIGSCTKAFTSAVLGTLEEDGKYALDKPVTDYLPGFKFYNNDLTNNVTTIDLMSHRTGLPRHDYSWYSFPTKSRDSLVKRIQYLEPSAKLREKWQYSNFMFLLQGVLAEKLTGKSWEQNVKERFFTPLGMTRSNLSVDVMAKDDDAALGYTVKNDSVIKRLDYYNLDAVGPAGSINSSVTEMANWVITWINKGKFNGKEILPPGYVSKATTPQMATGSGFPGTENPDVHFNSYGMGWSLLSYRGHYRVEHGGNIDGFSASTCFFPSDSIGIVVLANQNGSMVPSFARNMIADRMLKLGYVNWSGDRKKEIEKTKAEQKKNETPHISSRIAGTTSSHVLSAYTGNFTNEGYGTLDVYLRNDSLFAQAGKDSVWLRHYHYDIFELKGYDKTDGLDVSEGGTKINFRFGEDGSISGAEINMEPNVKPIQFKFSPKVLALSAAELEKYTGEYLIGGMTAKVYVKDGLLYVFVPGQPDYETVYIGDHRFKLKALDGFSVKFILSDNKATAADFIQPNGTFRAARK